MCQPFWLFVQEIKFEPTVMCEHIDTKLTFRSSQVLLIWLFSLLPVVFLVAIPDFCFLQLEDGDIICYQKSPSLMNGSQYRYADVPSFLEYVHNRQVCLFVPLFLCTFFVPNTILLFPMFSCTLNSFRHLIPLSFAVTGCSFSIVRKAEGG